MVVPPLRPLSILAIFQPATLSLPQDELRFRMNQLESASLARLVSRPEPPENQSAESHGSKDTVWNKISRETYVVGGGLVDGIAGNARQAIHDPAKALPQLGIAVGTGALMALAHGRGVISLGAKVLGLSFAVGFVKDLTNKERLSGIGAAVRDTWKSSAHLDQNRDAIKHHAGQFAFDTAVMTLGGAMGAGAMRYYGRTSELPLFRERTTTLAGTFGLYNTGAGVGRHLPAPGVIPEGPLVKSKHAQLLDVNPKGVAKATEVVEFPSPNGQHTVTWKPSEHSVRVRLEAQSFVDKLQKGDYMGALNVAVESPSLNGVELNPANRKHSVPVKAADIAKNTAEVAVAMDQMGVLGKFEWKQTSTRSEIGPEKTTAIVPEVHVELKPGTVVPLVEFVPSNNGFKAQFPDVTVSGAKLTIADIAQINSLRNSPAGQRMIAETAIIAFEESTVHANQHNAGGIISPTFAQFSKELTLNSDYKTRSHLLAFIGTLSRQDPNRSFVFEQEVPALLYDAGMPLSMIKQHYFFGPRHVQERTPVMKFLEQREGL